MNSQSNSFVKRHSLLATGFPAEEAKPVINDPLMIYLSQSQEQRRFPMVSLPEAQLSFHYPYLMNTNC